MLLYLARVSLPIAMFLIACFVASSQKQNIIVFVKDSATSKPLSKATAVIVGKTDSVLMDFGITDSVGKYLFKNVNIEKAGFIIASVTGYNNQKLALTKPLKVDKNRAPDLSVEIRLSPEFVALQDVVVTGTASPVKMNKDTLEFNADFFKSQPNAVLEDLLRKLPGVEIRKGNEVYVNGQRVNKILIDGKEFFSSDPIVILKNLPAEIIAKVQVADEKNTVAKETREQKDIPKTINLKLKKEFKKGTFGKFFGGYGTDKRYEAGGIVNTFRDTLQISLIGSSNNQGRSSFSWQDLNDLGGFGRSEGIGVQNSGDLANRYSRGIETNNLGGVNVNYNIGKTIQLNGQYFYNGVKRFSAEEYLEQQLLGDSALLYNGYSTDVNREGSHKAGIGLKWKQDSTGYLTVQVNTGFNKNSEQGTAGSKAASRAVPMLSASNSINSSKEDQHNLYINADYTKAFVKRKLDWSLNGRVSNEASYATSATNNRYVRIITNFLPDSLLQQKNNSTPNREINLSSKWNKTWKDHNTVSWKAEYANREETIGGDTYQFSKITGNNDIVPGLSVKLMLHKQRVNNEFSYRYSYKGLTIQPGIAFRNLFIKNRYNYDSIPVLNRTYNLVAPTFNINYKGLGFSFDQSLQEPYAYALKPVTDSSYPLFVRSGNPNLKPAKRSTFSLTYNKYFERMKVDLNIVGTAELQKDAIGNSRQVFPDGKTVYGYINIKSATQYNGNFYISKSYNKNDWNYTADLSAGFYISQSPLMLNQQLINTVRTIIYPNAGVNVGYKEKFRWRVSYGANLSWSKSDALSLQTPNAGQHALYNSVHLQLPRRLSWDVNVNYNFNPGMPAGYKKEWLFFDMAITCSLLKKDQAQIKLSGFDIFNQNQGTGHIVYENYIYDYRSLVQKQYFMLTLFYSLKKL